MNKKNNKEIGCLGCVWNPFDSPSEPCPDAFKDHAQYCNAYSHRMKFKELGRSTEYPQIEQEQYGIGKRNVQSGD